MSIRFTPESSMVYAPVVKRGQQGTAVAALQTLLVRCGYILDEDGIFGAQTETVVKQLQSQRGLPSTGVADSRVWDEIGRLLKSGFVVQGTAEAIPARTTPKPISQAPVASALAPDSNTLWYVAAAALAIGAFLLFPKKAKRGRR